MVNFANLVSGAGSGVTDARMARVAEESALRDFQIKTRTLAAQTEQQEREGRAAAIKDATDRLTVIATDTASRVSEFIEAARKRGVAPERLRNQIKFGEDALSNAVAAYNQRFGAGTISEAEVRAAYLAKVKNAEAILSPAELGAAAGTEDAAKVAAGPRTTTMTPEQTSAQGLRPGTVAQQSPTGAVSVVQQPKDIQLRQAFDPEKKAPIFATDEEIVRRGLQPIPNGMSLKVGENGEIELLTGDAVAGGLGTKGGNQVDEELLSATKALGRVNTLAKSARPEFLNLRTQLDTWWTAQKERGGLPVAEKDRQLLADFTTFKQDATNNLNITIKELTGATMTNAEAERITAGAPNLEDSPTQFFTKLNNTQDQLAAAVARLAYIKKKGGLTIDKVSLTDMPSIMRERQFQISADLNADSPDAEPVLQQLAREFGLVPP